MSTALVLEGGGMRGLYTAGVLDAFIEADIQVDAIIGVSAGALFGVNLASCQKGRALRYNQKFIHHPSYMSLRSWMRTGNLINKNFTYYEIPKYYDVFDQAAFEASGIDFYAVATDVETGQADYLKVTDVMEQMEALRASSALPFVSEIVTYQGKRYMDGGFSDSIPVQFAKSLGYDKVIVVLTRPRDYRKKPSKGYLIKAAYRKYPKFVEAAVNRYRHYNEQLEEVIRMEELGQVYAIHPKEALNIGRLEKDPKKFEEIHAVGLADGRAHVESLRPYLADE